MTADLMLPLVPELALFALSVLVLVAGLMRHPSSVVASGEGKRFGWITLVGLLAVFGLTFTTKEGSSLFNGAFVQDGLALFAKRLVLAAAALSVLASLTNRQATFARRAPEYHFTLLFSLLGMMAFAFIARPVLEPVLGLRYDAPFLARLAEHTRRLFLEGAGA